MEVMKKRFNPDYADRMQLNLAIFIGFLLKPVWQLGHLANGRGQPHGSQASKVLGKRVDVSCN